MEDMSNRNAISARRCVMRKSFLNGTKRKVLVAVIAALLPAAMANAYWGGYAPGGWGCDPQAAYLEEYGFLDPFGPSRTDMRRLHRDEWRATTSPTRYYGGYTTETPVTKAVRKRCRGGWNRGWRRSHYRW
jgi:hypothetical protein